MKTFHVLFLVAVLNLTLTKCLIAKENFLPGMIILTNGDTLKGFIDFRNKMKNPDSVAFTVNVTTPPDFFRPDEINGFLVDRYKYVSGLIPVNLQKIENADTSSKARVFLMALFEGKKGLYYWVDKNNKGFFFIPGKNRFDFLIYREYNEFVKSGEAGVNGSLHLKKDTRYIGQLILYLSECNKTKDELAVSGYSVHSLKRVYSHYYDCINEQPQYELVREKVRANFGLLGGISYTNFLISDVGSLSNLEQITNAEYDKSITPAFGAYCDLVLPRNNGRWSLNTELLYTSFNVTGNYKISQTEDYYTIYTTNFDYSYLGMNAMIRFSFPIKKIQLFVNAGGRVNFEIAGENTISAELHLYDEIENMPPQKALDTVGHEAGFLAGAGIGYGRFSLQGRYCSGFGITNYGAFSTNISQFGFLAGVRIL